MTKKVDKSDFQDISWELVQEQQMHQVLMELGFQLLLKGHFLIELPNNNQILQLLDHSHHNIALNSMLLLLTNKELDIQSEFILITIF